APALACRRAHPLEPRQIELRVRGILIVAEALHAFGDDGAFVIGKAARYRRICSWRLLRQIPTKREGREIALDGDAAVTDRLLEDPARDRELARSCDRAQE